MARLSFVPTWMRRQKYQPSMRSAGIAEKSFEPQSPVSPGVGGDRQQSSKQMCPTCKNIAVDQLVEMASAEVTEESEEMRKELVDAAAQGCELCVELLNEVAKMRTV